MIKSILKWIFTGSEEKVITRKRYSEEEDILIMNFDLSNNEIAKQLNRTENAIRQRRRILNYRVSDTSGIEA